MWRSTTRHAGDPVSPTGGAAPTRVSCAGRKTVHNAERCVNAGIRAFGCDNAAFDDPDSYFFGVALASLDCAPVPLRLIAAIL